MVKRKNKIFFFFNFKLRTLLNIIGTIDKPSTGSLKILGDEVTSKSSDNYLADLRLKKIGFVFQTFNLIATMSAFENVELPMT